VSDDPILECPSCGARLKVKAASIRALKEIKCAKCRASIPTTQNKSPSQAAPVAVAALPTTDFSQEKAPPAVIKIPPATPIATARPIVPTYTPPAAPGVDQALSNRVASLEARLAEQENLVAHLHAELTTLREANTTTASQWLCALKGSSS
jgi:predicted Zn finger-like uncharacterized protein